MLFGRDRDRDGVDLARSSRASVKRPGADAGGDLFGPRRVGVDHRDELDAGQRREDPGVMASPDGRRR